MYECLKNSAFPTESTTAKTNNLQVFFKNVHEKITQNTDEKHLLAQQNTELQQTLNRNKNQVDQNLQLLKNFNEGHSEIDAQILQMK